VNEGKEEVKNDFFDASNKSSHNHTENNENSSSSPNFPTPNYNGFKSIEIVKTFDSEETIIEQKSPQLNPRINVFEPQTKVLITSKNIKEKKEEE